MLSERIPNWAKMIDSLAFTMKTIAIRIIPEPNALQSTGPYARHKTTVRQVDLETQRDQAMATLRLVNFNR